MLERCKFGARTVQYVTVPDNIDHAAIRTAVNNMVDEVLSAEPEEILKLLDDLLPRSFPIGPVY